MSEVYKWLATVSLTFVMLRSKTRLFAYLLITLCISDAAQYATNNDCHFIEISTALNVNMDELLIGILCSIKRQLTPVQDVNNQENSSHLKPSGTDRRPRSSSRALSAISNFLKHACRRDNRRRDVTPVPQLV